MSQDFLQRFVFENASVRGEIVRLDQSFQTIMKQHGYPSVIQQLLGEALVAASLLTAIIKFKGRMTVQFQGKNKLKLLLAQCNHEFQLRGLAQFDGEIDFADLDTISKEGIFNIIIEPEKHGQRYQGVVPWEGGSLAQSLEGYFRQSEQLPTRIWMAVGPRQAVGFLVQTMPQESTGRRMGKQTQPDLEWEEIIHLTSTVTADELLNLNNSALLHRLYFEKDIRLFEPIPIEFKCSCSPKRGENAILLLGRQEAEEELKDKQAIAVTCEFCNKEYIFDRVDVERIFKSQS